MLAHALFPFLLPTLEIPLWLRLAGKVGWESPCPLGKVLTYKNLIYLLNFPFYCDNTSYLVDRCRITTQWMKSSLERGIPKNSRYIYINVIKGESGNGWNSQILRSTLCPPPPFFYSQIGLVRTQLESTKGPRRAESSEIMRKMNRNYKTILPNYWGHLNRSNPGVMDS